MAFSRVVASCPCQLVHKPSVLALARVAFRAAGRRTKEAARAGGLVARLNG
jgi:hypothetical protein